MLDKRYDQTTNGCHNGKSKHPQDLSLQIWGHTLKNSVLNLVNINDSCSTFSVVRFSYRLYKISELLYFTLTNLQFMPPFKPVSWPGT